MNQVQSVVAYIQQSPWEAELSVLRSILRDTELTEELKWGTPHYMLNGKIVVGIAGFKSYFGLWFHQGVFLNDPLKVLINAQSDKTRGLRQWRFHAMDELSIDGIRCYVLEAIQNQKRGKEIKPQRKRLIIPDELKEALSVDNELNQAFEGFTPGKQREFAEYISSPKQLKTKINRLRKIVPMIKAGQGLNDQYK